MLQFNRTVRYALPSVWIACWKILVLFLAIVAFAWTTPQTVLGQGSNPPLVNQITKVLPQGDNGSESLGRSVSITGNLALVGAYRADTIAGANSGAAYIYSLNPNTGLWVEIAKLIASDANPDDHFGWSVALSEELAVVGARYDDDMGFNSGSVYLFAPDTAGNWQQISKLKASDGGWAHWFGSSVAVVEDRIFVGAERADNDAGIGTGAVYVFEPDVNGGWQEVAKLTASDGANSDSLGNAVAASGDMVLVGAADAKIGANDGQGAAYLFAPDAAGEWQQITKLTALYGESGDGFGFSVALSGAQVLIGAYEYDGVDIGAGAAYLFAPDVNGTWQQIAKLVASDGDFVDNFGFSVALTNDKALIGTGSVGNSAYLFEPDVSGDWQQVTKFTRGNDDRFGTAVSLSDSKALIGAFNNSNEAGVRSGAAYIFDGIDNWAQEAKLLPSAGVNASHNEFGRAVAISGNWAIVGEPKDDNNAISNAGAAYIYRLNDSSGLWDEMTKLTDSDSEENDEFGFSVAINGNRAAVGTIRDNQGRGAVYVFEFNPATNTWEKITRLTASDAKTNDNFGSSISLVANQILIGASGYYDAENDLVDVGAAYLFELNPVSNQWEEKAKFTASDGEPIAEFGHSVSLSGDKALIGAYRAAPNGNYEQGAAYLFALNSTTNSWDEVAKLIASDGNEGDNFGNAVALSEDRALIGAFQAAGFGTGAAYIFEPDTNGDWQEITKLAPTSEFAEEWFGRTVALDGNSALVGASFAEVDGNYGQGGTYLFGLNPTSNTWEEQTIITTSDGESNDRFGEAVALSGNTILVGAFKEDQQSENAGAAYFFEIAGPNESPTAIDDNYSLKIDTFLSVAADGILTNDNDPENQSLTAVEVNGPINGWLELNSDGSFDYTPDPGFVGVDTFTYMVSDGTTDSNEATVSMQVVANADVNCSGDISGVDGFFILQMDSGQRIGSDRCSENNDTVFLPACDINFDGSCSGFDGFLLLQCDAGIGNGFCPNDSQ